jgi:hypothetical protein
MAVRGRTGIFPHRIDQTTDANASVDYEHKEVHAGNAYYVTRVVVLDEDGISSARLQTSSSSKWAHIVWAIESQANITIEIREGITDLLETPVALNRNRNYADANATTRMEFYLGAATLGTVIYTWTSGGAAATPSRGASPGNNRASGELVLKQNTIYEWRITSNVDANTISEYFTWYEHTNIEN